MTDHCVLRYLQRHHGIDVEAIRKQLTVAATATAADFGCDTVILGDGCRLKLNGDVASTCLEPIKVKRRRGRHR